MLSIAKCSTWSCRSVVNQRKQSQNCYGGTVLRLTPRAVSCLMLVETMKDDHLGNHAAGRDHLIWRLWTLAAACLALMAQAHAGFWGPSLVVSAPKYGIFETSFKSSIAYTNPLEDAALNVVFTSPAGDMSLVHGFWDGGKTWRV